MNLGVPGAPTDALMRVPLFADLDSNELELLAGAMEERIFAAGETVTSEGSDADGFFVVASGVAEVTVEGQARGTMTAGDVFGEIAMLMGSERTATIRALSELRCWILSPGDFRTIVEGDPTIAWKVMQSMAERLS